MDEFGLEVVEMPNALKSADFLSKNPQARADDLMQAFSDSSIKAVISTIGGDDSIRVLPFIDLSVIKNNPKIFMGYSDTSITHYACLKAGLSSFYGPAFMSGFAENAGMHRYLVESVRRTLFSSNPIGLVSPSRGGWTVQHLDWDKEANQKIARTLQPNPGWKWLQGKGKVRGHLMGGCIEVVDWLRGTDFWPSKDHWKGAILFFETSEEAPPPVALKRMLRNMAATGDLTLAAGLIFGRPGGSNNSASFEAYDQAILEAVRDEAGMTNVPIITQMDFGHTDPIMTLPFGILAEIDCGAQSFSMVESAVVD
jgi:muramoyltetrapeptide carboxypeptidase LdcA involved in peptidoglycan recycling